MKEYNFSGISTEKLENAIQAFNGYACAGLSCNEDSCPFNTNHSDGGCKGNGKEREHKLFKEELKRREEKEMSTMPELKAGMIVELESLNVGYLGRYLYINDGWLIKDLTLWMNLEKPDTVITKIFKVEMNVGHSGESYNFSRNIENHKLIWSKKSDTQIKIDELSETINKANAQIEELRKGLE